VGERSVRGHACCLGDPSQGGEHPAGEDPSSHETEHEQERQGFGCSRSERVEQVGLVGDESAREDRAVGHVTQEEHPHSGEQQAACEHEEPGITEGEFEADA